MTLPVLDPDHKGDRIENACVALDRETCRDLKAAVDRFSSEDKRRANEYGSYKNVDCDQLRDWMQVIANEYGSRAAHFKGDCDRHPGKSRRPYDERRSAHYARIRDLALQYQNMKSEFNRRCR